MLEITPIPLLSDNYTWLLRSPQSSNAVVVDPGDAQPVLKTLKALDLSLTAILITHHHADHTAGIEELVGHGIPVYGPGDSAIPKRTHAIAAGETFTPAGLTIAFQALAVPGHTLDHLAFYGDGLLFAGDALFAGGCGRMFEGTPVMMQQYLAMLRDLPGNTQVYCGHEYTLANLTFAAAVEPDNQALRNRLAEVREQRERGAVTLPTTIADERATNPFLRWDEPTVIASASQHAGHAVSSPADVFAALRAWKDHF